jgi:hypothetical protein
VGLLRDTNKADQTMARDWNEQENDDADAERDLDGYSDDDEE